MTITIKTDSPGEEAGITALLRELMDKNAEAVKEAMKASVRPAVSLNEIADIYCNRFELGIQVLKSQDRTTGWVDHRHLLMFIMVVKFGAGHSAVGRFFARDHSSVSHAVEKIRGYIQTSASWKERYCNVLKLY